MKYELRGFKDKNPLGFREEVSIDYLLCIGEHGLFNTMDEMMDATNLEFIRELDNNEHAGTFMDSLESNREDAAWGYKHLFFFEDGYPVEYWFQYAWVPASKWIRLGPPPTDIQKLVDAYPNRTYTKWGDKEVSYNSSK